MGNALTQNTAAIYSWLLKLFRSKLVSAFSSFIALWVNKLHSILMHALAEMMPYLIAWIILAIGCILMHFEELWVLCCLFGVTAWERIMAFRRRLKAAATTIFNTDWIRRCKWTFPDNLAGLSCLLEPASAWKSKAKFQTMDYGTSFKMSTRNHTDVALHLEEAKAH